MKKYRIAIEETLRKVVEIEAETPGLAVCRAEDEYNEEKHVLSADNFADQGGVQLPADGGHRRHAGGIQQGEH